MKRYWLHVNHPTNKAILHIEGGCLWVVKAVCRVKAGEPYGPKRGNLGGYWKGFDADLAKAEKWQQETGKKRQGRCQFCPW